MHAISSYHGNRPHTQTNPQTHTQTHRQDRLQYTAPQLASAQYDDDNGDDDDDDDTVGGAVGRASGVRHCAGGSDLTGAK